MEKLNSFITKNMGLIIIVMFFICLFRNCSNEKTMTRRIENLTEKVDSLQKNSATKDDIRIEGLKAEKRMIQSTDRKILDVNRQSAIDKELLEWKK